MEISKVKFREIYKYALTDNVMFRRKRYVVVGRSDFICERQNKYLIQDYDKYDKTGVDYYACIWVGEDQITLVNETNTDNTITDAVRD
jgi:hypothetical protein